MGEQRLRVSRVPLGEGWMTSREAASRGICWEELARLAAAAAEISVAAGTIQGKELEPGCRW